MPPYLLLVLEGEVSTIPCPILISPIANDALFIDFCDETKL